MFSAPDFVVGTQGGKVIRVFSASFTSAEGSHQTQQTELFVGVSGELAGGVVVGSQPRPTHGHRCASRAAAEGG